MDWFQGLTDWYGRLAARVSWTELIVYAVIFIVTRWIYMNLIKPFLSPLRKFPGKPYRPIVGNMFEATRAEAMSNAIRWVREVGALTLRYYSFGGEERLLTADPQVFRHVLITNSSNYDRLPPTGGVARSLFSKAVFFLSGQEHHQVRKLLNPAFGLKVLDGMVPVFEKHCRTLAALWQARLGDSDTSGCVMAVQEDVTHLALDSICEIGLDYHPDSLRNPDHPDTKAMSRFTRGARVSLLSGLLPFYSWLPVQANRTAWQDEACVRKIVWDKINTKKQTFAKDHTQTNKTEARDVLSLLVLAKDEDGKPIPEQFILENVAGILFGGFDTTSTNLTWTLLQLATYPDIQHKAREEIQTVFPTQESPITHTDLDKLHYLSCVVKETHRLFPTIGSVVRKSVKDDCIDGHHIPAGTVIVCHMGALHRMEQNWENAEEFDPERFMNKDFEPYKLLPFIGGPYMCIGHKYSTLEVKTVLSVLLRQFEFSLVPGYKYRRHQSITVLPKPALVLQVRRVTQEN